MDAAASCSNGSHQADDDGAFELASTDCRMVVLESKYSNLITELIRFIPKFVSPKKSAVGERKALERASMLKLATGISKLYEVLQQSPATEVFSFLNKMEAENSHLVNFDGAFVVLSTTTQILYISPNVSNIIPYTQAQLVGADLVSIAVADDRDKIRRHVSTSAPSAKSSTPHWFDGEEGSRKFFHFRLKGEPVFINVMGIHRVFEPFRASGSASGASSSSGPAHPEEVFLGVMRQVQDRPVTEMSLFESFQDEYYTRHMLDGTIIFADQRISNICGYLPTEVLGKSAFGYIYGEDIPWTQMAQRHMLASTNGEGFTTYRLLCKDQSYVTLQTRGYLEFNQDTKVVESFLCINKLIRSKEHSRRFLKEQMDRFTPYIARYKKELLQKGAHVPSLNDLDPVSVRRKLGEEPDVSQHYQVRCEPILKILEGINVVEIRSSDTSDSGLGQVGILGPSTSASCEDEPLAKKARNQLAQNPSQ